ALRLASKDCFTEKATLGKVRYYGFLAAHRYKGEIYPATLDVENRVRGITLRENVLTCQIFTAGFSGRKPVKEIQDVECERRTPRIVSPLRDDRQAMTRNRRKRESAAQWDLRRRIRHCSETSSHDRYLSVLQSLGKGMT